MSARAGDRSPGGLQAGRRRRVSPLLIDPDIPDEVVEDVVDTQKSEAGELKGVLVELNLTAGAVVTDTRTRFRRVYEQVVAESAPRVAPRAVAASYVRCLLTSEEIRRLVDTDAQGDPRTIFRVWPDYVLHAQIDRSVSTVKVDAASRTYGAGGAGIVWAVLDTGIDRDHPHFAGGTLTDPAVRGLHRDFTWLVRNEAPPRRARTAGALVDVNGHGTHVAGIIAGAAPADRAPHVATLEPAIRDDDLPRWSLRAIDAGRTLSGMAPLARLVSLKVLDTAVPGLPRTTSSAVIEALEYVRRVNAGGRLVRIHGINISLGCPWSFRDFPAGQSPLCRELDLLVASGVVAVVSAGNAGYGGAQAGGAADLHGVLSSITDPGNAMRAITVGATHRDRPHTMGVAYLSSKGPTLDGRLKPDVVAPGLRITSCATGLLRDGIPALPKEPRGADRPACYAEDSGTSMAAPHVSGAIASLLSVRPELSGRPDDVKQLITATAISLGRDRFFEGHGLIDLMGALARI